MLQINASPGQMRNEQLRATLQFTGDLAHIRSSSTTPLFVQAFGVPRARIANVVADDFVGESHGFERAGPEFAGFFEDKYPFAARAGERGRSNR